MADPTPFVLDVAVRASELDADGHAAPAALLDFLQEAAGAHAVALGWGIDDLAGDSLTWVLSRLRIQCGRLPAWRRRVSVTTWPSGTNGLYATRDYLVHDEDGTLVARGTSDWLVLDVVRRRPVRVPPAIAELVPPDRPRALPSLTDRLAPPSRAVAGATFTVRRSDLDVNRHVNNVRYAEWALAAVPEALLGTHRLAALELHFRAETTFGDAVVVTTGPAAAEQAADAPPAETTTAETTTHVFAHRLVRADDEREVALARSAWTPRTPA